MQRFPAPTDCSRSAAVITRPITAHIVGRRGQERGYACRAYVAASAAPGQTTEVDRVEELRLRADLAEALQRFDALQYRYAVARYTSSGSTDDPADLDVQLLRVEAVIAELEERLAPAASAAQQSPAPRSAVDLGAPPANDTPAPASPPELLTAREAAKYLRLSVDTLERLRQRPGDGPPFKRVGRRVLYPLAGLRDYGSRK